MKFQLSILESYQPRASVTSYLTQSSIQGATWGRPLPSLGLFSPTYKIKVGLEHSFPLCSRTSLGTTSVSWGLQVEGEGWRRVPWTP